MFSIPGSSFARRNANSLEDSSDSDEIKSDDDLDKSNVKQTDPNSPSRPRSFTPVFAPVVGTPSHWNRGALSGPSVSNQQQSESSPADSKQLRSQIRQRERDRAQIMFAAWRAACIKLFCNSPAWVEFRFSLN